MRGGRCAARETEQVRENLWRILCRGGLFRSGGPHNWTVGMSLFLYRGKTIPIEGRQMERYAVSFSEGLSRTETAKKS